MHTEFLPEDPRDLLIAWTYLPFLTPARTHLLLEALPSCLDVIRTPERAIASLLNITLDEARLVKNPLQVESLRDGVKSAKPSAVTLLDDTYPPLLREIHDPPPALFVRGDVSLLSLNAVAVVGSRDATPYGINAAATLARRLADRGISIVSGMARGIDAAAHTAALACGGTTVAVLGTGIDVVYPRAHRRLAGEIEARGVLVTQFPAGTPPLASNFPMRNRIIAGLSLGTVIVEATGRSGSLITARMAAEQGREVFAVPGSIFSRNSEGAHRLVQYGAKLVHDVDDIVDELEPLRRHAAATPGSPPALDDVLARTLAAFNFDEGVHIDTAAGTLGVPVAQLAGQLLELELQGLVRALPGARWVRVAS